MSRRRPTQCVTRQSLTSNPQGKGEAREAHRAGKGKQARKKQYVRPITETIANASLSPCPVKRVVNGLCSVKK